MSDAQAPTPNPKPTADGSAPVTDPQGLSDALASGVKAPAVPRQAVHSSAPAGETWGRGLYVVDDVEQHPAVRELRAAMPDVIVDIVRFRDETTIHVKRESLREVASFLRDHEQLSFNMLTDITAIDMLKLRSEPRFDVVVLLYSLQNRVRLRLKAGCNDGEPVPSMMPLWNGANWLERETFDMFGIIFEGHTNLRRILLPDEWDEGFPLRKDYPLRGWREFPVYNKERKVERVTTRWSGRGV